MSYVRRMGDERPFEREPGQPLTTKLGHPIRWLPRHGQPFCLVEWLSQKTLKALAYLPIYTAIVVSITLLLVLIWHG